MYEKKENIITEKVGIKETYRKIMKRNIFRILIFILIRYKKSTEVIIIKTKTKTIIIIIVNLSIITEKAGIKETYRKIIKRNILTILIIILIR